jgi:hypothetical protein
MTRAVMVGEMKRGCCANKSPAVGLGVQGLGKWEVIGG